MLVRRRRDTTARTRAEAIARAKELVERLAQGTRTDLAQARGAELVAHYLDPNRRPPRGQPWSERHREEQDAYCRRFVTPVLGPLECSRLGRADFHRVLDAASTASVAAHLRRCLSALVGAGLEEGYLLARQDVLRGVRWRGPEHEPTEEVGRAVAEAEIPTATAVHALARAAAKLTGVWWRELEVLLVAYSRLRWGEHAALRADQIDASRRCITVDRQVVEGRHGLRLAPPKGRKRRITMYPARTPDGVALAELVARRIVEAGPDGLVFPSPRGHFARRSGYGRRIFAPAAAIAGWPKDNRGRRVWTFHSLRHVCHLGTGPAWGASRRRLSPPRPLLGPNHAGHLHRPRRRPLRPLLPGDGVTERAGLAGLAGIWAFWWTTGRLGPRGRAPNIWGALRSVSVIPDRPAFSPRFPPTPSSGDVSPSISPWLGGTSGHISTHRREGPAG